MVSTNTPGKPFSPKSMMRSIPREHKIALDLENSGVFNKNFGNIKQTKLLICKDLSKKKEHMLEESLLRASSRYRANSFLSLAPNL